MSLGPFIIALCLALGAGLVVHRFFFHPLKHIPGPPLAVATYLYESYYDHILDGQFTFQLKALHEKFGEPMI